MYLQRFLSITSRIERVIMMSLIRLLLNGMQDLVPMVWVAIIYGSVNIICMTLLHTVKTRMLSRVLYCVRRITLFVFTHAVMRAALDSGPSNTMDSTNMMLLFLKGFTILCTLTLIPQSVIDEDDGDSFSSQITYAYATNMGGFLDTLHTSRLFTLITFVSILVSPQIHSQIDKSSGRISKRIISNCLQAFDLVIFDAFTSQAFIDSGDLFCDLSIVLGSFCVLWNFHTVAPDMAGIQQFTTWRTASFVSNILSNIDISGVTLALVILVLTMLHSEFSGMGSIIDATPWLQDLMFLVSLNGIITETQKYIETIGAVDGIPVLFGLIVIITTVNASANMYTTK
jgi:hypothetical protein